MPLHIDVPLAPPDPAGAVSAPASAPVGGGSKAGESSAEWMKSLPYWFAVGGALVYATGFLVDFTFCSLRGIQESTTTLLKAQYVYIGLLCLLFPASCLTLIINFLRFRRNEKTKAMAYTPSLCMLLLFAFDFYLLVAFSSVDLFSKRQIPIFALFICSMLGVMALRKGEDWLGAPQRNRVIKFVAKRITRVMWNRIRWGMFVVSCGITVYVFWDLWGTLGDMILKGGYLYVGFIGVIGLSAWMTEKNLSNETYKSLRGVMLFMSVTTNAIFAYLAVIAFAYRVYVYIPVGRGGGDYTAEKPAILWFDSTELASVPDCLRDPSDLHRSSPVIIIRDTPDWMYVASPNSDLKAWRDPGQWPKNIVAIKQSAIISVSRDLKQAAGT
ncbi:MAG: hypothetical protein ABSF29_10995 [Tepidisphaeraceae bacterium]|jgi:hypothetical protein